MTRFQSNPNPQPPTLSGAPYACCFHSTDECVDIATTSGCHNVSASNIFPSHPVHEVCMKKIICQGRKRQLFPPKKFPLFFGHLHRLCAQHLQVLMPHKRLRHLVFQGCCASRTRGCLMFDDMCIFGHHWPSGLLHVFQREEASVFSTLRILL